VRWGAIHMFLGVEKRIGEAPQVPRANAPPAPQRFGRSTNCPRRGNHAFVQLHALRSRLLASDDITCDARDGRSKSGFAVETSCRTEIYSGTALRERLAAEGRLEGELAELGLPDCATNARS